RLLLAALFELRVRDGMGQGEAPLVGDRAKELRVARRETRARELALHFEPAEPHAVELDRAGELARFALVSRQRDDLVLAAPVAPLLGPRAVFRGRRREGELDGFARQKASDRAFERAGDVGRRREGGELFAQLVERTLVRRGVLRAIRNEDPTGR